MLEGWTWEFCGPIWVAVLTSLSKSPQGRTCFRLNLSSLWAYSGTNLAFKVPQGRTCLRLNLSFLWDYSGATSLSKSSQGRTCLRLNLSILWAYGGTNLAFKVPPGQDMLEVEPEELVAPTLPGINGQPVLLHLPKILFNLHYRYGT